MPFVGAGLSAYGDQKERLPLWGELLERLLAEGRTLGLVEDSDISIDEALRSHDFNKAAEMLVEALGEPTYRRVVEHELNDAGGPIPPAIDELVKVDWPLVVTTNLDRLIARAYRERHGEPMAIVTNLDTHRLAAAFAETLPASETVLAQIHGEVDVYASWKLTNSDYEQLFLNTGYVEALKLLFLRRIFFVGFGLKDEDFDILLRTVAQIYPAGVSEFFALIPRSRRNEPALQNLVKMNGLRPIFYDVEPDSNGSDPFGGHRAVYECLAHLAQSWAVARTHLDVALQYFPELDPYMVGRDEETAWLADLVGSEQGRIIQVVGLGGLGKTSLVQQFIEDCSIDIAEAGYCQVFGCSFYRADIAQFINDLLLAVGGTAAVRLPEQVEQICEYTKRHRVLLILDGVETIIDRDQRLRNPYLQRIIDGILEGTGTVIFTTRVRVRGGVVEDASLIDIKPLSDGQILNFLDRWGLGALDASAKTRLIEITAGHPLALRILAGVLRGVPVEKAVSTIERSAVIDISDEVDPLRENRLARVLGSYIHYLDEMELALLICSTAFEAPAPYPLADAALARRYSDTDANRPLVGQDLRPVVSRLLEQRLLTVSATGELSSHPTVREYFARLAREGGQSLTPIHRFLAAEYLSDAVARPGTFDEAPPLLMACRHAAAARDWGLFDDLFRNRLMRGFRNYLCNNLGAWEECLELARLGADPSFPTAEADEPAFYPITVARCLKHLGRSTESRAKYFEILKDNAPRKDPNTAKYVHNLLTLLVWRGELEAADRVVEANVRALSWIDTEWERRWQVDHSFSALAYLRMLQGDPVSASSHFDVSAAAWDGYDGERLWAYDYYPYYRSELVLIEETTAHEAALGQIEPLLSVAESHSWPESICRGHIQAAVIYLDRAGATGGLDDLNRADQRLASARLVPAGMNLPDVAIAHLLTTLKADLVHHDIRGGPRLSPADLILQVERAEALIQASGLELSMPEVIAARGVSELLGGRVDLAADLYQRALHLCQCQGNCLAPVSPRSLLNWLGSRLNVAPIVPTVSPRADLSDLIGMDLPPAYLIHSLEEAELAGSVRPLTAP